MDECKVLAQDDSGRRTLRTVRYAGGGIRCFWTAFFGALLEILVLVGYMQVARYGWRGGLFSFFTIDVVAGVLCATLLFAMTIMIDRYLIGAAIFHIFWVIMTFVGTLMYQVTPEVLSRMANVMLPCGPVAFLDRVREVLLMVPNWKMHFGAIAVSGTAAFILGVVVLGDRMRRNASDGAMYSAGVLALFCALLAGIFFYAGTSEIVRYPVALRAPHAVDRLFFKAPHMAQPEPGDAVGHIAPGGCVVSDENDVAEEFGTTEENAKDARHTSGNGAARDGGPDDPRN